MQWDDFGQNYDWIRPRVALRKIRSLVVLHYEGISSTVKLCCSEARKFVS